MRRKDKVVTGKFEDAGGDSTHCRRSPGSLWVSRTVGVHTFQFCYRQPVQLEAVATHRPQAWVPAASTKTDKRTQLHLCSLSFLSHEVPGCVRENGGEQKGDRVGFACFPVGVERLSPEMKKVTISYSVTHTQNVGSVVKIYLGGGKS